MNIGSGSKRLRGGHKLKRSKIEEASGEGRQEAGGSRQEAGGRRQEAGGFRQVA